MIYLDNAATTGQKPESVIKAVNYTLMRLSANPGRSGHSLSIAASELVFETRNNVADYFGASGPECVVFTQNCTHSANIVLKGVLEKGDHAVVSDLEHNAVMRPLNTMKADYSVAEVSLTDDDVTLKNFENAIKPNTKLIFVTAASNVIGKALPLKKLGELAHRRGILFGVDSAQAAGVMPIDMKDMQIDFLCIAPHKGLYAPMGTGILIAEKPIYKTVLEGGTGTESVNMSQPENMPEHLESGTLNLPGIAGINSGIKFIKGIKRDIYSEEMSLVRKLYGFLKQNGKTVLYTPFPDETFAPVLSFNFKDISAEMAAMLLNSYGIAVRAGLHCAPSAHRKIGTLDTGTVRISPGIFNSKPDILKVQNVIKKISENQKKIID